MWVFQETSYELGELRLNSSAIVLSISREETKIRVSCLDTEKEVQYILAFLSEDNSLHHSEVQYISVRGQDIFFSTAEDATQVWASFNWHHKERLLKLLLEAEAGREREMYGSMCDLWHVAIKAIESIPSP